jgi:hypothetical protein
MALLIFAAGDRRAPLASGKFGTEFFQQQQIHRDCYNNELNPIIATT